jgi:hypothetical protein
MEDTFWMVLERKLGQCEYFLKRQVEVINFGVSGYGTAQELMTLRHVVWTYAPDIVILAFTTGNDIRNNLQALDGDPIKPYFVYRDNQLVLDDSFRNLAEFRARKTTLASVGYQVVNYSRLLQVVNQAKNQIKSQFREARQQTIASQSEVGEEMGLDSQVYVEPKDDLWKEAWRVTEGLIQLMRDEVQEKGADFVVVTLSNGIQANPDSSIRKAFRDRLGVADLFYPDFRIRRLGEREAFMVINLAPVFQAYAERHNIFLHGFGSNMGGGHWNPAGHRLAGETIAQELCSKETSLRIETTS